MGNSKANYVGSLWFMAGQSINGLKLMNTVLIFSESLFSLERRRSCFRSLRDQRLYLPYILLPNYFNLTQFIVLVLFLFNYYSCFVLVIYLYYVYNTSLFCSSISTLLFRLAITLLLFFFLY